MSSVVFAGGATGVIACGAFGTDCPHTVVDRQATVSVSQSTACQALSAGPTYQGWGSLAPATCKTLCNDSSITNCFLPNDFVGLSTVDDAGTRTCPLPDGSTAVTLTCQVSHDEGTYSSGCPVAGRLTLGLAPHERSVGADAGAYFAQCAELEAISVHAFQRLAAELRAFGAPSVFVDRARRAAEDEVAHTTTMTDLAARFGHTTPELGAPTLALRPMFDVALENAVEGAIRETFGAAIALHQSVHSHDRVVREAHARIANDERTHAELAIDLERWFDAQLGPVERDAIAAAKRAAIAALRDAHVAETSAALVAFAGLPSRDEALRMIDELDALLWIDPAIAA